MVLMDSHWGQSNLRTVLRMSTLQHRQLALITRTTTVVLHHLIHKINLASVNNQSLTLLSSLLPFLDNHLMDGLMAPAIADKLLRMI